MGDNDNDKTVGNPLREVGAQFQWDFVNPATSSRGTRDGYKYFLKVEIKKELHDLLVDAELAGMVVANVGQVVAINGDYSEALEKEMVKAEAVKAEKCPQAIEYHKKHKFWPSNTAEFICREENFFHYLTDAFPGRMVENTYEYMNHILKDHCDGIDKKRELDTNHDALTTFLGMLTDYRKFVQDKK